MNDLTAWDETEEKEEVSIVDLDTAVQVYLCAKADYEAKKQLSNDANAVMKEHMRRLETLMSSAGKKNWETDEGKAIIVHKMQYTTPKDPDAKKALAQYMQDKYGKEMFWDIFGVNSQTLNAWAKQELENNPELMNIPGLDSPTSNTTISFRRKSK